MQKFTFTAKYGEGRKKFTVYAERVETYNGLRFYSYVTQYLFYMNRLSFCQDDKGELIGTYIDVKNLKEEHNVEYKKTMQDLENEIANLNSIVYNLHNDAKSQRKKKKGWFR